MFSGVQKSSNWVRFGFAMLLVMVLALSAPLGAAAAGAGDDGSADASIQAITREVNIASRFVFTPRSPNILIPKQPISITFNYNTTWTTGIIVVGTPFSGTAPTASSTPCTSLVLPVGHGTGSCKLIVAALNVRVTAIRFQVWNSAKTALLFQAMLPVNYLFSNQATLVRSITTTPSAPAVQVLGKGVSVKFTYRTSQAGGVRIVAIPYSGAAPTANYTTCASPIYATGTGTGTCRFVVSTAPADISSVHIEMWDATLTTKLTQFILPLAFRYRSQLTMLTRVSLSPATPNIVRLGDKVFVHFNYQTNQPAGVVVEAVPFTGTAASANATVLPSAVLPTGTGIGSCSFQIMAGTNPTVDRVRFQVFNSTHTTVLFTVFYPVQFQFH